MADYYNAPTAGPTADYAGDPNDYQGSTGNSFDFNSIAGGISSIATPLFGFISSMYASSQHQGAPGTQYGPGYYPQGQQPQQQSTMMLYYVGAALFFLLVLAVIIYALKKK